MERLQRPAKKGFRKNQLFFWGMLFVLAGLFSRGYIQNRFFQVGSMNPAQLLEMISASRTAMIAASAALVMQAIETCAVPLFAFLLVDGFVTAKSRIKMLLILLIVAAASEIPFNYVMYGKFLNTASQNPSIALVIGMAVLYFFRHYEENSFKNVLIRIFVGISAILWAVMMRIDHGVALLALIMTMWALRNKKHLRALFASVVATACVLISPFYIVSAMGIFPVHLYQDEEDAEQTPIAVYAAYPVLLLIVGALSNFI